MDDYLLFHDSNKKVVAETLVSGEAQGQMM